MILNSITFTIGSGDAISVSTRQTVPYKANMCSELLFDTNANRVQHGKNNIVVGNKQKAIEILWELITQNDQWTLYIENLLDRLSINSDNYNTNAEINYVEYSETYPFATCNSVLPVSNTGKFGSELRMIVILTHRRQVTFTCLFLSRTLTVVTWGKQRI